MTNSLRSENTSLLMCVFLVLLLLFLFIFPRKYLNSFLTDITNYATETRSAIIENDVKLAKDTTKNMLLRFEYSSNILKLFLNHEDIDELGLCINSCYYGLQASKIEIHTLISGIETILKQSEYLFDVETLSLYNLF